jgi:hypothetical protein
VTSGRLSLGRSFTHNYTPCQTLVWDAVSHTTSHCQDSVWDAVSHTQLLLVRQFGRSFTHNFTLPCQTQFGTQFHTHNFTPSCQTQFGTQFHTQTSHFLVRLSLGRSLHTTSHSLVRLSLGRSFTHTTFTSLVRLSLGRSFTQLHTPLVRLSLGRSFTHNFTLPCQTQFGTQFHTHNFTPLVRLSLGHTHTINSLLDSVWDDEASHKQRHTLGQLSCHGRHMTPVAHQTGSKRRTGRSCRRLWDVFTHLQRPRHTAGRQDTHITLPGEESLRALTTMCSRSAVTQV